MLVLVIIFTFIGLLRSQENSDRLLTPPYEDLQFPSQGFIWIDEDLAIDSCLVAEDSLWYVQTGSIYTLYVAVDGPRGSGRFWTVTIGLSSVGETRPQCGFCLPASTVGWRTLRSFTELPLPWVGDSDGDGQPELIIWDSFPLHKDASLSEFGLMGWVYELDPKGRLKLSLSLCRKMAATIATAYRRPLDETNERLQKIRNKCAEQLDIFASRACQSRDP